MADTLIDEIKIIISATDKAAEEKIDALIARLENLGNAATGTGNASKDLFKKMASGAGASGKALAKTEAQAAKQAQTLARIKTEAAKADAYTAKAEAARAKSRAEVEASSAKVAVFEERREAIAKKALLERSMLEEKIANASDAAKQKAAYNEQLLAMKATHAEMREVEKTTRERIKTEQMLENASRRSEAAKAKEAQRAAEADRRAEEAARKRAEEEAKYNSIPGYKYDPSDLQQTDRLLDSISKKGSKASSAISNLFGKIKSVIMYRMIRSAIRMVTDGFREGIQNAYQWSKAINGAFASSMDSLATSAQYLKNSLGALVAPLINALAPAIEIVVDKIVDFLNVINQLIARLTNQKEWIRAVRVPKEYAAAWDDAAGSAGAAAKAARTILGIDELNPLNGANGSGGGGGGGGGGGSDYSSMFTEETEFLEEFGDEKLSGLLDSISRAVESAQNLFAAAKPYFEDFMNGAIKPFMDLDLAVLQHTFDTIADGLDTITSYLNGDISGFELFKDLGQSLGTWAYNVSLFGSGVRKIFNYRFADGLQDLRELMARLGVGAAPPDLEDISTSNKLEMSLNISGNVIGNVADLDFSNLTDEQRTVDLNGRVTGDLSGSVKAAIDAAAAAGALAVDLAPRFAKKPTYLNDSIKKSMETASMIGMITGQKFKNENIHNLFLNANMTGTLTKGVYKDDTVKAKLTTTNIKPTITSPAYEDGVISLLTRTNMFPILQTPGYAKGVKTLLTKTSMDVSLTGGDPSTLSGYDKNKKKLMVPSYANFDGWGYSEISGYDSNKKKIIFPSYANFTDHSSLGTLNADVNFSGVQYNGKPWLDVILNVKKMLVSGQDKTTSILPYIARGGAFFGNKWHDIAQYATGGVPNHGSLFVAGEAGAEIVGHVGGRTEVLNQSQIASTIAAATQMSNASQNNILMQLLNGVEQLVEGQGDVRAYIPAGEVVSGLQRNNRRDGRALVPMGV